MLFPINLPPVIYMAILINNKNIIVKKLWYHAIKSMFVLWYIQTAKQSKTSKLIKTSGVRGSSISVFFLLGSHTEFKHDFFKSRAISSYVLNICTSQGIMLAWLYSVYKASYLLLKWSIWCDVYIKCTLTISKTDCIYRRKLITTLSQSIASKG